MVRSASIRTLEDGSQTALAVNLPDKGHLIAVVITLRSAAQGPVRVGATFRPEAVFNKSAPLSPPKWIRADTAFGVHDGWRWDGKISLVHRGEKDQLVFISRNDSGATVDLGFTWVTE